MRRHGISLLELLIAMAVGLSLLMVVLSLTGSSARTLAGVERHLESLHAAQLNLERIEADLQHLLLRSRQDLSMFDETRLDPARRDRITWFAAQPGPSGRRPVYVGVQVEYHAVPTANGLFHLARNGVQLGTAVFRRIEMHLHTAPALAGGRTVYFVRTTMVGVDAGAHQPFELEGLCAIDALCAWSGGQDWNPNADQQAPTLAFVAPH